MHDRATVQIVSEGKSSIRPDIIVFVVSQGSSIVFVAAGIIAGTKKADFQMSACYAG